MDYFLYWKEDLLEIEKSGLNIKYQLKIYIMLFNYIDTSGNKGSIDIINTDQNNILVALPKKYQKDKIIKINRQKNKIYIVPMSTRASGKNSTTELIF